MNFVSCQFISFLLVVLLIFRFVSPRGRIPLILAASYVFYASWSIPFVVVILLTTSIDYFCSKIIHNSNSRLERKLFLWLAISTNLAILGYFKYFNFFLESQFDILTMLGKESSLPKHLDIILPLGISYYTFEAISYVVDVYRQKIEPPSFLHYNFYIMYFPHLIAGPIIRFEELHRQFVNGIENPTWQRVSNGLELILFGYAFKIIIAGGASVVADPFFANPECENTFGDYLGCTAFIVELYFDFLGYTQIARGISLLFNIELPANFNHPGNANNVADFWHRWQISLSRWLHDYVFQPLGGARKSLVKTMSNVFLTLLIAGIWHGAGLNFLLLGIYWGVLVSFYHCLRRLRRKYLSNLDRKLRSSKFYSIISVMITFWFLIIGGVFFRAQNPEIINAILSKLLSINDLLPNLINEGSTTRIFLLIVLLMLATSGPLAVRLYQGVQPNTPNWLRAQTSTVIIVLCWILSGEGHKPFLYFQF